MTCYFDIANFREFSKQNVQKETTEESMACLRMLKKNFNIILNDVAYDDLDEEIKILIEEFQSGVEGEFGFRKGIIESISKCQKEFFGSILLLDQATLVSTLKNKNQILVGCLTEETETLSKLLIADQEFHSEEQIGKHITFDNFLNLKKLPVSKIFIIDRYLFKGPEIGGNLGLFEFNIQKLLQTVFEDRQSKIDIIFVYQVHNKTVAADHRDYDNGPEKSTIVERIKKMVHKHCPKPNVCMIAVPKGKIEDEHDRHIITDYLRIKSGDSFAYFKSTGEIGSKSLFVDFYSHGKKAYKDNTQVLLSKINTYTNECIAKYPGEIYIPSDYDKTNLIKL